MFGYKLYHPSCWYFLPVYQLCRITGVLPLHVDKEALLQTEHLSRPNTVFNQNLLGWLLSFGWTALNFIVIRKTWNETKVAFSMYDSCFDEFCADHICRSVCAHYSIIWVIALHSLVTILITCLHRACKQARLLNKLFYHCAQTKVEFPLELIVFVFLFVSIQIASFLIQWSRTNFSRVFIDRIGLNYLTLLSPLTKDIFISALLMVVENLFKELNASIAEMMSIDLTKVLSRDLETRIEELMVLHGKITKITVLFNRCFQFDFLASTLDFLGRTIHFCFLQLRFLVSAPKNNLSVGVPHARSIVFFLSVISKFVYLCYRCEKATVEAERTKIHVRSLYLKREIDYNRGAKKLLKQFEQQIDGSTVAFVACDLFTMNLKFLKTTFGVITTYFIILLQFQSSAEH